MAVNSQVFLTNKTTFKYLAWSKKTFFSRAPPRLRSSSSITTREIEASADSVPAKNPAKAKSAMMEIMGRGFIYFQHSIVLLGILAGRTLLSLLRLQHGHIQGYAISHGWPK